MSSLTEVIPENKKSARGGNRTPTGLPTGSLILRVYQFRHPSILFAKQPLKKLSGAERKMNSLELPVSQAFFIPEFKLPNFPIFEK